MSTQESVDAAWEAMEDDVRVLISSDSTDLIIVSHRPVIEDAIRAEQDAELVRLRAIEAAARLIDAFPPEGSPSDMATAWFVMNFTRLYALRAALGDSDG
jgi:hypothetical protein